jgi:threonine synthase
MKKIMFRCCKCGKTFRIDEVHYRCDECDEPLELEHVKEGKIKDGNSLKQNILERYSDFFPFLSIDEEVSLGEGFTGLVESKSLAKEAGVEKLYFKNESQNPTWSFKDRGTYVGIQHVLKLGYKRIGTVSTGNMAPSVAAYGSKTKLETFILVSNNIPDEKMNPIGIYGPNLIKVDGDYGKMYYESLKIGKENDIYFLNSDSPFRVEGSKTIAFEICEQLDFEMPDYVVIPTSAGGNIRGIEKGFSEFRACGLIDKIPKIIAAQARGCSPIADAYEAGEMEIERVANPKTIAHAIENPYPPSGNQTLRMLEYNGGMAVSVTEEELLEAQGLMAKTGLFGQPASAVPFAAVRKLKNAGRISSEDSIVCILTGSGLKYTAAFAKHDLKSEKCSLEDLSGFISKNY